MQYYAECCALPVCHTATPTLRRKKSSILSLVLVYYKPVEVVKPVNNRQKVRDDLEKRISKFSKMKGHGKLQIVEISELLNIPIGGIANSMYSLIKSGYVERTEPSRRHVVFEWIA